MAVPLFDIHEQNDALENELQAAFSRVLKSGHYILGSEVSQFEEACARVLGVKHALGISSGTDAILLALMALGIGPGDEVLCPSFTFFATAGCVRRVGATPVFVDSCPVCFNLNVTDAAQKVTPRTKAIIPVHLFGQSANMDAVMALAAPHHLLVVEDAAQAFSARYRNKACGTMGHVGTYSFFPTKNLGGFGDSGLLVTNDDTLAERARILRVHGMEPKYHHAVIGGNFRIDPLQAALLNVKLPHLATYSARRKANAAFYTETLSKLPGVTAADPRECHCVSPPAQDLSTPTIILPVAHPENDHIWNQYTLLLPHPGDRDKLRQHLVTQGIGCEIYYPIPLHLQDCFKTTDIPLLPVAEALAQHVLSLPVFPELPINDRLHVVESVASFYL